MPHSVMTKVWDYFENAERNYGLAWPIEYQGSQDERLDQLRGFGVVAFTSLVYAHKPGMAQWLNEWSAHFASAHPDCLSTATFFPEPGVLDYSRTALAQGAQVFKIHLQVGGFDPRDQQLDPVWDLLAEVGVPTVVHCGSGPIPGPFTGPGPIGEVLARRPDLPVIVAHMGAPEYGAFLDLAARHRNVKLDTTMAFTDFMNNLAQFPVDLRSRLLDAGLASDVLFGSDFPNIPYTYAQAVDALVRLGLGEEWLRAVLFANGSELFALHS